jgi:hypothetical protein
MGMKMETVTKSFAFLSVAILAIALCAGPALSDTKPAAPAAASLSAQPSAAASPSTASRIKAKVKEKAHAMKAEVKEKAHVVKAALSKANPLRLLRDKEYKTASALFPSFCKDWGNKLHEREVNNLDHLNWQEKDGYETATYTGYGPIEKCECHQSSDGYSIGKVTYDEFQYYLVGKTADEAKHAKPKVTDSTATTELFRWDKNKWFY